MIKIYYTYFTTPFKEAEWQTQLQLLPEQLQANILLMQQWQARHASLLGKLLLREALQNEGYCADILNTIKYTKYKKPYIETGIDFNISHSGELVVCAISNEGKIGIDIEKIVPIEVKSFSKIFSAQQWQEISENGGCLERFYYYWTLKESIVKADGRGLSILLRNMQLQENIVLFEDKRWITTELALDVSYKCFLAATQYTDLVFKRSFFYTTDYL